MLGFLHETVDVDSNLKKVSEMPTLMMARHTDLV
jgi:hypothetical protein